VVTEVGIFWKTYIFYLIVHHACIVVWDVEANFWWASLICVTTAV